MGLGACGIWGLLTVIFYFLKLFFSFFFHFDLFKSSLLTRHIYEYWTTDCTTSPLFFEMSLPSVTCKYQAIKHIVFFNLANK